MDKQKSEADAQLDGAVVLLSADAQNIWNSEAAKKVWKDMISEGVKAVPYLLAAKRA